MLANASGLGCLNPSSAGPKCSDVLVQVRYLHATPSMLVSHARASERSDALVDGPWRSPSPTRQVVPLYNSSIEVEKTSLVSPPSPTASTAGTQAKTITDWNKSQYLIKTGT